MRKSNEAKSYSGTENALHHPLPTKKEPWEESDEEFMQFVEELHAEIGGYAPEDVACVPHDSAKQTNAGSGLYAPGAKPDKSTHAGNDKEKYA